MRLTWPVLLTVLSYLGVAILSHARLTPTVKSIGLIAALAIVTFASIATLVSAVRADIGHRDLKRALWCAAASAALCTAAPPIHSHDFWYYIAAGRFAASGGNVYTQLLPLDLMESLSLPTTSGVYSIIRMGYGPAWVWISTALSSIAGPNQLFEFVAYKSLMLVAWAAMTWTVYRAVEPADRKLRAIVLLGWLPLPMVQSLVDGHNDVVMVALMAGWLSTLSAMSTVLLVLSALIKFPTAPIVLLAMLDTVVRRRWKHGIVLMAAVGLAAAVIAAYWQDGAVVDAVPMGRWSIFTPVSLIAWIGELLHLPSIATAVVVAVWRLALAAVVLRYGRRYVGAPSRSSLAALVTALLLALLLGSPFIHPWYLVWILPSLALATDDLLENVALPLIVALPLVQIVPLSWGNLSAGRATLLLYALASIWWATYFYRASSFQKSARAA